MSQYLDPPWASSEEFEQKVTESLRNQFQSCFPFLFKQHKWFSPEDENQYLRKNWALYHPYQRLQIYGWGRCGEIEANANFTFPFEVSEGCRGKLGEQSSYLWVYLQVLSLSSHTSWDILSEGTSGQYTISCHVWCMSQCSLSYAAVTNISQFSAAYSNKGLLLTHIICPLRSAAAKF